MKARIRNEQDIRDMQQRLRKLKQDKRVVCDDKEVENSINSSIAVQNDVIDNCVDSLETLIKDSKKG